MSARETRWDRALTGQSGSPQVRAEAAPRQGPFDQRHPYLFVALLLAVFVGVDLPMEAALSTLVLPYLLLAAIAAIIVTRKRWWKETGFTLRGAGRRSLLLFLPAFLPLLWWVTIAPMAGLGTVVIPPAETVLLLLMVALLIGFVEEVYFRGMMVRALRSKGLLTCALVTAFLFGPVHLENMFLGASPVSTVLQVGYAIPLGLTFAALVLAAGVIWPLILLHGLLDFVPYLNPSMISATTTQADYITAAVLILFYAPYAWFLLRRLGRPATLAR